MVALLGLLQHQQILLQFLLLGEGDGVEAGELLALLIPAPIGSGHAQHLHRLDARGVRNVRPAAQIGEIALGIEGDLPVLQAVDQLQFVLVAFLGEVLDGVGLAHFLAVERELLGGEFLELGLDGGEITLANAPFTEVHVVVEPVLDGRADAEFGPRIERLQGFRHHVGGGMPHRSLAFQIVPGEELQRAIAGQGPIGVAHFAVHFGTEHVAGKAFADALGYVHGGHALVVGPDGTVRQGHMDAHRFARPALQRHWQRGREDNRVG